MLPLLAYQLFGKNEIPKIKADKFVASYYVLFETENKKNPKLKLEEKAQDLLLKWEEGDKETIELWKKLMKWVFVGYKETYSNFKVSVKGNRSFTCTKFKAHHCHATD